MHIKFYLLKSYNQGKGFFLKRSVLGVTCKLVSVFFSTVAQMGTQALTQENKRFLLTVLNSIVSMTGYALINGIYEFFFGMCRINEFDCEGNRVSIYSLKIRSSETQIFYQILTCLLSAKFNL